mmetsp:Transcript_811/g.683  ORF Transcript_811/g.683 Transcript_811/m.683 type:complete len:408 (-) Transcript_811:27-1250(-)
MDQLNKLVTFSDDQNRNLKEVFLSLKYFARDSLNEDNLPVLIESINKKCPGANQITLDFETICFVPFGTLLSMKQLKSKAVLINKEAINTIKVKSAKLNILNEGVVRQITFSDVGFNIGKDTSVIVHDSKYVFINAVEQFTGELSKKEEDKEAESFLKDLIEEYEPSGAFSAYAPGDIENYSILLELEDLKEVTLYDPLIVNNVDNKEVLKDLLNEGVKKLLRGYEPWDILPKPNSEDSQVIPRNVSIKMDIGTNLIIKKLGTFFDILTNDYSYLKIEAVNSFYYMTQETIAALDKLLKSKVKSEETKNYAGDIENRYINSLTLKVAFEEDLYEVLKVLGQHPVLNIQIRYDGDVTDDIKKTCRRFIVKFFNRNIEIMHDGLVLMSNKIELEDYEKYDPSEYEEYEE